MRFFKNLFNKKINNQEPDAGKRCEEIKSKPSLIPQSKSGFNISSGQPNLDNRSIRIFISSTFRDMMEERDVLMTHCWPELRRFCKERQVELVEVDLRWGIAEEQSTRKETLKLCLDEIRACRPFFIGLLGERYGWVPGDDAFTADLKEEQPWLKELKGKSVTELEILHGVLNNPEMAGRAFFYFRDPKFVETVPRQKKIDFLSKTITDEEKQTELKNLIRKRCYEKHIPLLENYFTPQSLAAIVLEQLKAAIQIQFPVDNIPDSLIREAMDQEASAKVHRRTYIGRPDYYKEIDNNITEKGTPLVLLGDSGSGKSALLANWVDHWRKLHPNDFIFQHYIGTTPDSVVHWKLMTRLMAEIKHWTNDPEDLPVSLENILRDFPLWLFKARMMAEQKGVLFIVVLDALNQLEDKDHGRLLGWLPEHSFAGALRLITSTLPGNTLDFLEKRAWSSFHLQPLTKDERRRMIVDYLNRFSKKLDIPRLDRLSDEPATANPLYLKILLDELRVTGTHDNLDKRLDDYIAAKDIPTLLGKVLTRYQRDYEQDRKGLVSDALGLIWTSRRGLTEAELLQLLRPSHLTQLPLTTWAPLRNALEEGLLDRGGILNFAHDFFSMAVEKAFSPDQVKKDHFRNILARFFEAQSPNARNCDELPWLLWQTRSLEKLQHCLLEINRFIEINKRDQDELLDFWVKIKKENEIGKAYFTSFNKWYNKHGDNTAFVIQITNSLGDFLNLAGHYNEAEQLLKKTLDHRKKLFGENHLLVAKDMSILASVYFGMGRASFSEAERLYKRALEIYESSSETDLKDLCDCLNGFAGVLNHMERYTEAEQFYNRALSIRKKIHGENHIEVASTLCNISSIYTRKHQYYEAEQSLLKAIEIDIGLMGKNYHGLIVPYSNLAFLYSEMNRFSDAELLFNESIALCTNIFGKDHFYQAHSLWPMAKLFHKVNRIKEAEAVYKRVLEIYRSNFGETHRLFANPLNQLAHFYMATERFSEAETLFRKELELHLPFFGENHISVMCDLDHIGNALECQERFAEAEPFYAKSLAVCNNLFGEEHVNLVPYINNLARLLQKLKKMTECERLLRKAISILFNQSVSSGEQNQYLPGAIFLYKNHLWYMGLSEEQITAQLRKLAPGYF